MSTSIDTISPGGTEDRRLVLSNAQAARIIDIGTNWTTLRIGMRYCIENSLANYVGAGTFFLGAIASPLSDMSNGPLTSNTSHFVGMYNASNILWIDTVVDFYTINSTNNYCKRVGNTTTNAAGTNQNHVIGCNGASPKRAVTMIEIVKGSPNFTINVLQPYPGSTPPDTTSTVTFRTAMSAPSLADAATVLGGGTYLTGITGAIAVNEAVDGYLNAICVAWGNVPSMYISDFGWAKIA